MAYIVLIIVSVVIIKKYPVLGLCIFLPPFAVADRGIITIFITAVACIVGWFPGILVALFFNYGKIMTKANQQ